SVGPVPRLRDQCPPVPEVPGILPREEAPDPYRLGQERQDLPGRRRVAVSTRLAPCRDAPPRHRSFRAGRQAARDCASNPQFPRSEAQPKLDRSLATKHASLRGGTRFSATGAALWLLSVSREPGFHGADRPAPESRDISVRDMHVDTLKVKTRNSH